MGGPLARPDACGQRAAALYSPIGTAKLNELDPEKYLRQALGCIARHPINRIDELLPWKVAAQRLSALPQSAGVLPCRRARWCNCASSFNT
jgi:hypothetical protein